MSSGRPEGRPRADVEALGMGLSPRGETGPHFCYKRLALKSARVTGWQEPSSGRTRGACRDRVSGRDVPGLDDEGGGGEGSRMTQGSDLKFLSGRWYSPS